MIELKYYSLAVKQQTLTKKDEFDLQIASRI